MQQRSVDERVLCAGGDHSVRLVAGKAVAWHGTLSR